MPRVMLTIEYDGAPFCGWQRQDNAPSVQGALEDALLRLTGEKTGVVGASRTDAGVHARGQVAHFDTESRIPPERFVYALNTLLPPSIRVQASGPAPADFHARFSARGKRYGYAILNRPHASALMRGRAWHVYYPLDLPAMERAAARLVGTHDFTAFCAAGGNAKTFVRTLDTVRVGRFPDGLVVLTVSGNAFLYNMVRIIAGTLVYVGAGMLPESAVTAMLETGDRTLGGPTAPPQGLVLEQVFYADTVTLPASVLPARPHKKFE